MKFKKIEEEKINELLNKITKKRMKKYPKCGSEKPKIQKSSDVYKCTESLCLHIFNIWRGTVFNMLRTHKRKVLEVLELWIVKASKDIISYATRLDKKTIRCILKKANEILIPQYHDSLNQIGGQNIIVEIDESKFGKRKYNKGHHVKGVCWD